MGRLAQSRAILESALQRNACHPLLLENLMSVQMQLGDWDSAAFVARRLLMKVNYSKYRKAWDCPEVGLAEKTRLHYFDFVNCVGKMSNG